MKRIIVALIFIVLKIVGSDKHQALFIFQEHRAQFKTDAAGMNIAHQFLACLQQKSAPILISQNIWEHIVSRKQRFDLSLANKSLLHNDIINLLGDVNSLLALNFSLDHINKTMDQSWYNKKYPRLSQLDETEYKAIMFDFLCSNLFEFTQGWKVYLIDNYLLFVVSKDTDSFYVDTLLPISNIKKNIFDHKNESFSLVPVLSKILNKEFLWSFYISGHGDHIDKDEFIETIVGMPLKEFRRLILFLEKNIQTNLLLYSSCYGSGVNLMEPYQSIDEYKNLSFTIITTCLTDAPVYTYGTASGLFLPPYDQNIYLKKSCIHNNKLHWSFIQSFSQFKNLALEEDKYKDLAQAIMPYQECNNSVCSLSQIENIPLIKRPKEIFFVPLDSSYVDFIVHNRSEIKSIQDKAGLLWYIKQYKGTVKLSDSYPQFVNMIPGDGVIWAYRLEVDTVNLRDFIVKSFFSIDDMHGVKVFIFDTLSYLDTSSKKIEIKNCMIIPKSSWIPKDFVAQQQKGACFYQYNKHWYYVNISSDNQIQPQLIQSNQCITFVKLWKLLRKESQSYGMLEALDLIFSYKKRQESYQEILKLCKTEQICS